MAAPQHSGLDRRCVLCARLDPSRSCMSPHCARTLGVEREARSLGGARAPASPRAASRRRQGLGQAPGTAPGCVPCLCGAAGVRARRAEGAPAQRCARARGKEGGGGEGQRESARESERERESLREKGSLREGGRGRGRGEAGPRSEEAAE
eukprot:1344609-Rhodomonas_salina.1